MEHDKRFLETLGASKWVAFEGPGEFGLSIGGVLMGSALEG